MSEANDTPNDTLLLVDGSSYLYRAYHALPDLRGPGGVPTGAIHGMVAMLKKLRADVPCCHAACVLDAKGRTFRDDLYAEYKANRKTMPEPLAEQLGPIRDVIELLGWPVIEIAGIEADDAIGTLARVASARGQRVVVSTGDKDLAQLVDGRVTLINTMSNETLDEAGVVAKFGVPPGRIVDYLTLIGDSVDNVPGVDKVGPKTAAKWIADHGSLDGVIAAAATFKGVTGDNLRRALDWLPTGRRLVTISTDCDLSAALPGWPAPESMDGLVPRPVDRDGLLAFYERFGFKTWKRELEAQVVAAAAEGPAAEPSVPAVPAAAPVREVETVLTRGALARWLERLKAAELVALHTQADGFDPVRARLVGISLSPQPGQAAYIPLGHDYPGAPDQLPADEALAMLRPWLEDESVAKLGHHVKFDAHVFANHGVAVRGWRHDTLLQSYVLEAHRPHGLESLSERHLGRRCTPYEEVCGKGAGQIPFAQVEVERAAAFSGESAETTLRVHQVLWPRLQSEDRLREVYAGIEMPVSRILARIERHGVLVDTVLLGRQGRELAERMHALEQEAYGLAGQPFNLGSPKQICDVLFTKLGLPVLKKTASGAPSTDEEVLEKLAEDYPLPARILEHRSFAKLKGTYTDKLPSMVNPATGRVHTSYAQAVAVTGRLSSNDPNLQNIPIRTAEGRRIREAFIAPPGHRIVSADYSQIELRLMAHISGDEGLVRAFTTGMDVHRATAAEVFGVAPEAVTSDQRRYAKTINFGLIYGMSAFGLAANLGIERSAATTYIERYFQRYPKVKRYMDETRASAKARGFVETLYGRRVVLPEINSGNGPRRTGAERQAINAPMQGTAADLIKLAMIAVQDALDAEARATRMVLQVHDELVFEVPEGELEWVRARVPALMTGVAKLDVPLVADIGVGMNWDEAH
jgi:DNA polymerase-1